MSADFADAAAHNAVPDEFLWCIVGRRHHFPPPRREEKVRLSLGLHGLVLELFESITDCTLCGTTRTLWRDQQDERFVHAEYAYPDGYLAPPGTTWDRAHLRQIWRARHPVKGRTRVVTRGR